MEIDGFSEITDFSLPNINPTACWLGRGVQQGEIDPRIVFIRELVFSYLYHCLNGEKDAFKDKLLQTPELKELTPKMVHHLVMTYLRYMLVAPHQLPDVEEYLADALFGVPDELIPHFVV